MDYSSLLQLLSTMDATELQWSLYGLVLGMFLSIAASLSPAGAIAVVLPLVLPLKPTAVVMLLVGVAVGTQFGRRVAAARELQQPTSFSAFAPMLAAGLGALVVVSMLVPPLVAVIVPFGPTELLALYLVLLVAGVLLSPEPLAKGAAATALGLAFGAVGSDLQSGVNRLTFGSPEFADGVPIVAAAIGLFVIADVIRGMADAGVDNRPRTTVTYLPLTLSVVRGFWLGLLPGSNASLVTPASAEDTSEDPLDPCGKSDPGTQSAGAAAGHARLMASFLMLLTAGLPTNAVAALLLTGLLIEGVVPGPLLMAQHPNLLVALLAGALVANIAAIPIFFSLQRAFTVRPPFAIVGTVILGLAMLGAYSLDLSSISLVTAGCFGILGFAFIRTDCQRGLLITAFAIGPFLEEHLRRSVLITRGDLTQLLTRPAVLALGIVIVLALAMRVGTRIANET